MRCKRAIGLSLAFVLSAVGFGSCSNTEDKELPRPQDHSQTVTQMNDNSRTKKETAKEKSTGAIVVNGKEINLIGRPRKIAGYKGVPVLYGRHYNVSFYTLITVVNNTDATYKVVKAILEVNGFEVIERVLPDGSTVFEARFSKERIRRHKSMLSSDSDKEKKPIEHLSRSDEAITKILHIKKEVAAEVELIIKELIVLIDSLSKDHTVKFQIIQEGKDSILIIRADSRVMNYVEKVESLLSS